MHLLQHTHIYLAVLVLLRRSAELPQDFRRLLLLDTRLDLVRSAALLSAAPVPVVSGSTPVLLGADKSASPKRMELPGKSVPARESCSLPVPVGSVLSKLPAVGSSALRSGCRLACCTPPAKDSGPLPGVPLPGAAVSAPVEPKVSGTKVGRSGPVLVGKPASARARSMESRVAGSPEPVSSLYCPA